MNEKGLSKGELKSVAQANGGMKNLELSTSEKAFPDELIVET